MNQYLTTLFNSICIDINYLKTEYLCDSELKYLNSILKSEQDLKLDFYTSEHGDNLECLLLFLHAHKKEIIDVIQGNCEKEALIELYTSNIISGSYDCFRFNLSKFPHSYTPNNQVITLYRVGRDAECEGNLGCSWSTTIEGLNAYCDASGLSKAILESKPIFIATVNDSQVLFKGKKSEHELVLKPDFIHQTLAELDYESRIKIGR